MPSALFRYSPVQLQENTATNFTNQSAGASSYLWNFGDGEQFN